MIRIQTSHHNGSLVFKRENGDAVAFASDFDYNNKTYHFLGGFYYDLDPKLVKHIFGDHHD